MSDNILSILGVQDKEDVISNLLEHCINTSPEFAYRFVTLANGGLKTPWNEIRAYTRKRLPESGIPDIVIKASAGRTSVLFIVENKLKAEEGADQLKRYGSSDCINTLLRQFYSRHPVGDCSKVHLVYLTLFPDQNPRVEKDQKVNHITYKDLLGNLDGFSCSTSPTVNQLLGDLMAVCSSFYEAGEINPDDFVIEHLSANQELDGNFLYFQRLLQQIEYPGGLKIEEISRRSWSGRKCYLAVISKDTWHIKKPRQGLPFTIHIELQYDCLGHGFSIYVHYELDPYETEQQAVSHHSTLEITQYKELQKSFEQYMNGNSLKGFKSGGGRRLQVGKMRLELSNDTRLCQFQKAIQDAVTDLHQVIDQFPGLKHQ